MARFLLPFALAVGWIAALAAAQCPVSMTRIGPTKRGGPVRKYAGSKVAITAEVRSTQAVNNAIIALFLPADFKLLKTWTNLRGAGSQPIINGQSIYWKNVTLSPNTKKPARFRLTTKIPSCYPTSTVQVLGATYQINATDGLPFCLQNAQPAPIAVRASKRTKPYDGSTCAGAGAVSCYPGFYAPTPDAPCVACGINQICGGGAQPGPDAPSPNPNPIPSLVDCPLGTGTVNGDTQAYDPAQCVVLPCQPCGAATPDLYLTSDLSIYKQSPWTRNIPNNQDTAQLQCTLDKQDPFICTNPNLVTLQCKTNDIAIDNQGNYIVLGRRKESGTTNKGWVIKIDPTKIVPGQPCPYTVLIPNLDEPWAGLGAAPKSNLFYGLGAGSVFTVEVNGDTASIIGQANNAAFTGAADVTSDSAGNIYAVVGNEAYAIPVDANFLPIEAGITQVASGGIGSTGAGAFCTSEEPYGVQGSSGLVYEFVGQATFTQVGGSGFDNSITGAAVAPVCGGP